MPRGRLRVVTNIAHLATANAKSAAGNKAIFLVVDASWYIAGAFSNVSDVVTLIF